MSWRLHNVKNIAQKNRFFLAVAVSVAVTTVIFLFMHRLISGDPLKIDTDNLMVSVDIYQPPPESKPKEPPPDETPPPPMNQPVAEPTMAPLAVSAPVATPKLKVGGPPIASFAPSFDDVTLESGSGGVFGSGFGDGDGGSTWTGPSGNNRELAKKIAEADRKGAEGYREIVPFGTRQPNIPEAAWRNKTDGWVLVTFTVNMKGKVENVRVLDSQPAGLFDANVVAAVSDWIYDPEDLKARKAKVQLTQRIEMHWKDYPNNNHQLR